MQAHADNDQHVKQPKATRKGYMGQLRVLTIALIKSAQSDTFVREYTEKVRRLPVVVPVAGRAPCQLVVEHGLYVCCLPACARTQVHGDCYREQSGPSSCGDLQPMHLAKHAFEMLLIFARRRSGSSS